MQVWIAADSSIARTTEIARKIDTLITQQDGVRKTHWMVGGSTPYVYYNQIMNKDNYNAYTQGVIFADDTKTVNSLIPKLQTLLDENVPEARVIVRAFAQGHQPLLLLGFVLLGQMRNNCVC